LIRIQPEDVNKYRLLDPEKDFRYNMNAAIGFTLERFDDYYESISYFGAAYIDPTNTPHKSHYVYVLVNAGIPNVCKIGYTTTSVQQRCKEINSATGVLTPYIPVYSFPVGNGPMLEKEVHQYLEDRGIRINPAREGFAISSGEAIKIIEELGKKYLTISE
jgi:T5orf172 domain